MNLPFHITKKQLVIGCAVAAICLFIIIVFTLIIRQSVGETPGNETGATTTMPPATQLPSVETTENAATETPTQNTAPGTTAPPETTLPQQTTEATTPAQTTQPTQPPVTTAPSEPEDDPLPPPTEPEVNPETLPPAQENEAIALGIDVSKYQGVIDWKQVAADGIRFAMIRVGYRTKVDGTIIEDPTARYNLQQASKYGIDVGVYFFSTAITKKEAKKEAQWIADLIDDYGISYPVAYNCEDFTDPDNRQYHLTKKERTDIALSFLKEVKACGYEPMFYAARSELEKESQWEISRIEKDYMVWLAYYTTLDDPYTAKSGYAGKHDMWQYSANGTVGGIDGVVDLNVAYFEVESQSGGNSSEEEDIPWDELMNFKEVSETVTAKEKTNLRDIPSQGEESTVLYTLLNGETATRIGISDSGWSKLEFDGQICYAVSSYLTTDLSEPEYEIQTQFEPVNDQVTAKDVVNLRTLPSVTHEDSQVVAQLTNGEVITRTGINEELGWSRVEYNGQTLYCVSQYLMPAEEQPEETTQPTE